VINAQVRHIIESELAEGEELLWADKPVKRPYPWRGVFRAGFWVFWMAMVAFMLVCILLGILITPQNYASMPLLFVFPFVCLVMLGIGYALRKTYLKAFLGPKYEVYGLTNKRAIILSPLWKDQQFTNWRGQDHSKNFIEGKELDHIKIEFSSDQSIGTIIFSGWWDKIRFKWHIYPNADSPKILSNLNGFRNIPNPDFVTNLIVDKFGATTNFLEAQENNDVEKTSVIKEIKTKRVTLWSIFPFLWILLTLVAGTSTWLFLSFFTFPFFVVCVVKAIREIIRPDHSYRIPS